MAQTSPAPVTVTAVELAAYLDVIPRTVWRLADEGLVVRAGRGRYDLAASVRTYVTHIRAMAAGRAGDEQAGLTAERARLAREQADAVALRNAIARGEMVPAADVEREWSSILRNVRSRMLAVPSRVAARVPTLTKADVALVEHEVAAALTELADGE